MLANEFEELLRRLGTGVRQPKVSLRCTCDNLETVYVHADESGVVHVSDDHDTFQYLDREPDSTYDAIDELDMTAVRRLCEELGVELKDAPEDGYPSIECLVRADQPISEAVERVGDAIDRVFRFALRADLKN